MSEIKLNEIEVQKLNLQPGDVLVVRITSDEIDKEQLNSIKNGLKKIFSDNGVVVFGNSQQDKIDLTVVSKEEYSDNSTETQGE